MDNLKPIAGNTPALWARYEAHSDCPTVATDLGAGRFVMACTDHNITHLICEKG